MLQAICAIREFVGTMTFAEYEADPKTRAAVERMFQILTEAAFRLGRTAHIVCPEVDWRAIRGMGNFLRHDYEQVEDRVIWDAIQVELTPLERAVEAAIARQKTVQSQGESMP